MNQGKLRGSGSRIPALLFILIMLCIAVVTVPVTAAQENSQKNADAYHLGSSPAVRAAFAEWYPWTQGLDYPVDIDVKQVDWLEAHVPDATLVQVYAKFVMPPQTGTFVVWKNKIYVMPDDFDTFLKDAKIRVSNDEDALGLAEFYANAWEPSGKEGFPAAEILQSEDDIPQKTNSNGHVTKHTITPPKIHKKDNSYIAQFDSWCVKGGWLRRWDLSIDSQGTVKGGNVLLEKYVGNFDNEGAIPERTALPETTAAADVVFDRNIDIDGDGTPEFIIHWRPEDFVNSDDSVNTVVNWVDAAARASWQSIITTDGFTRPLDKTLEIYIWNDTAPWGKAPEAPDYGAYCSWPDSNGDQYIYILDHQVIEWVPSGVFYTTEQDAYTATTAHEFFHTVEYAYERWTVDDWIDEGAARFIPTHVLPAPGEFWQNSILAGRSGGPVFQDAGHRSKYIYQVSDGYIGNEQNPLEGMSYSAAPYWRYIYEHNGGISKISQIFGQISSDNPGGSFSSQVASINTVLGTTDIAFADFARANYLEFSPYPFARDNEFYQFSDRYYADMSRSTLTWDPTVPSYSNTYTAGAYGVRYGDIIPNGIHKMKISFNGDTGNYVVRVFSAAGSTVTEQGIPLDSNNDGSVTLEGTETLTVIGYMVARTDTSSGTYTIKLERINSPPTPEAGGPYTGSEGGAVTFDASGSTDPDNDPLQYRWDFQNDGTWDTAWSTSPTVDYTYPDEWTGTALLEVKDAEFTRSDTADVTILNVPPKVEAGSGGTINEGSTFSSSGSFTDPGTLDTWEAKVNYGDGSGDRVLTLTGKTFSLSHVYADNGINTVTVTVTDNDNGVGSDTATVTVKNMPPTVQMQPIGQPNSHFILPKVQTLTFTGTFTDPGWLDTHTSLWSFGDTTSTPGTLTEEQVPPDSSGTTTTTHIYQIPGTFAVTLKVTDKDGDAGTAGTSVTVVSPQEAVNILNSYIQSLSNGVFKGPAKERKAAFAAKFVSIKGMIDRKEYNGAKTALMNDIRAKADGYFGGTANDDWIKDKSTQKEIIDMVDTIVAYLNTMITK